MPGLFVLVVFGSLAILGGCDSILRAPSIVNFSLYSKFFIARTSIMSVIRELGNQGKTVLVSSHILQEIERITEQIVILHNGKLLAIGNLQIQSISLEIPHPRINERKFVLKTWHDIAPEFSVPNSPGTISDLLSNTIDSSEIRMVLILDKEGMI